MKTELSKEDLRLLTLILQKARALEKEFLPSQDPARGFTPSPRFESELAALQVLLQNLSLSENPLVQRQAELADHLHPGMTPRHFLNFLLPIERLMDRNLRDDDLLLVSTDDQVDSDPRPRRPLTLVLDHLRSAFNVGSIFRMAETLRADALHICGYTPGPESAGVQKTAMGTENLTPSRRWERTETALSFLREGGTPILALETSPSALSLYAGPLPAKCAFVVGNERFGLDFHTLRLCDEIRQIPLVGTKNSLNVASALSIACFEWHRQHQER